MSVRPMSSPVPGSCSSPPPLVASFPVFCTTLRLSPLPASKFTSSQTLPLSPIPPSLPPFSFCSSLLRIPLRLHWPSPLCCLGTRKGRTESTGETVSLFPILVSSTAVASSSHTEKLQGKSYSAPASQGWSLLSLSVEMAQAPFGHFIGVLWGCRQNLENLAAKV